MQAPEWACAAVARHRSGVFPVAFRKNSLLPRAAPRQTCATLNRRDRARRQERGVENERGDHATSIATARAATPRGRSARCLASLLRDRISAIAPDANAARTTPGDGDRHYTPPWLGHAIARRAGECSGVQRHRDREAAAGQLP